MSGIDPAYIWPQPGEDVGAEPSLFTEPVIGYRTWRMADRTLVSPYRRGTWPPGEVLASCGRAAVDPAHRMEDCSCGLYAYHSLDRLRSQVGYDEIVGAVVGWGEMHVHHVGWRAERGCVVALLSDAAMLPYDPEGVARRYGVPLVATREFLELEAAAHGSPLPRSAIPEGSSVDYLTVSVSVSTKSFNVAVADLQRALGMLGRDLAAALTSDFQKLASVGRRDRRGGPRGPRARGGPPRGMRR